MGLLQRWATGFHDYRDPGRIEHTVEPLIPQRVFALALGYEDLHDHNALRRDPLLSRLTGKTEPGTAPRAGTSTLNRLELTRPQADVPAHRYQKILFDPESADQLLVQLFVESQATAPESLGLALDAADDPLPGKPEGRFFHGYSGHTLLLAAVCVLW
jgi:Transposase DDE domain group 1